MRRTGACESLRSETLLSTRFSLNSCSHSGFSEHNRSHRSFSWFSFLFGFGFLVGLVNGSHRSSPFNMWTWHKCWIGISPTHVCLCSILTVVWQSHDWWGRWTCGRHRMINLLLWRCHWCWRRKTGGRTRWQARNHDRNGVLRIALESEHRFKWDVVFDRWSIRQNVRVHRKAFRAIRLLAYHRGRQQSRINPILWQKLWLFTSPLAVMTIVGLHDFVKVSISAEFKSFVLIMCIDAPESTTNSLSSGLRVDFLGRHQFSEGEKNAALFFSFNSGYFWPASTLFHEHIALAIPSDLQILEHWGHADEDHLGKSFQAMDFGLECQHDVQRLLWILHIGLVSICLSSSVRSMKTSAAPHPEIRNPIVVYFWILPLHFCHHSFWTFRLAVLQPSDAHKSTFPKSASILRLVEQAFWRMPLFTEWNGASSFEVILASPIETFYHWDSASGTSGSRRISRRRIRRCRFCTLIDIVTETVIVSF